MKTSASWRFSSLALLFWASVASAQVTTGDRDTVLWYVPYVNPATVSAATEVARLQTEVQRILDTGNRLLPAAYQHHDQPVTSTYFIYTKPGRIITTLAWAYPYLTAAQKTAVSSYVTTELAASGFRPWDTSPLTPTTSGGVRRELHPVVKLDLWPYGSFAASEPSVQTIYGLWLWGWRKGGDWSQISPHWSAIQTMYSSRAGQGNIYGTMGGHIGMGRLAQVFGNTTVQNTAASNLLTVLTDGLTFSTIDTRNQTYFANQYQCAAKYSQQYLGWMFLDIVPEIARYLAADTLRSGWPGVPAALTRHADGLSRYPWWWMRQSPFSTTVTGTECETEGSGLSPEIIGMIAPIQRYATGVASATMRGYARSGPVCIGDLYWIEMLVAAIESTGTLTWVDVRNGQP